MQLLTDVWVWLANKDPNTAKDKLTLALASVGATVTLLQYRKNSKWKRSELASNYLKDFRGDPEIVFVRRAIEWNEGRLVIPETLRPILNPVLQAVDHDQKSISLAMKADLKVIDITSHPEIQIYRLAFEKALDWLVTVDTLITRKLFSSNDIPEVKVFVDEILQRQDLEDFLIKYRFKRSLRRLQRRFWGGFILWRLALAFGRIR